MSGYGIADDYTWKEDALEIELTVQVPPGTQTKDVHFKAKLNSVDLRIDVRTPNTTFLLSQNSTTTQQQSLPEQQQQKQKQKQQLVLLDGSRKLRGRLCLDGTFWTFSDRRRSITITLEKYLGATSEYDVLDYDWKGIYPDEVVQQSEYDEPELLNVKEYAASLGVDVDNINRSMVDETMFGSGLNLTQRTLEQLTEKGYLGEVTQQADGSKEYQINPETGEAEEFHFDSTKQTRQQQKDPSKIQIPFLDTQSPWQQQQQQQQQHEQTVPVSIDETTQTPLVDREALKTALKESKRRASNKKKQEEQQLLVSDPIEQLTVKRLKEILKKQGLKVSGNKKELQERLRDQVNSMLSQQGSQHQSTTKPAAQKEEEEQDGMASP